MKIIWLSLAALWLLILNGLAQTDSISVFACIGQAKVNAAQQTQLITLSEISDLKTANATATNLPTLAAYGKAWYQSDAVAVPPMAPGQLGLEVERFQYNFGLEANQKIFDGGMSRKNQDVEEANKLAEVYKVETEMYQIYDKVIRYAFTSMFLGNNLEVLTLKQNLLEKRISDLSAGVRNGLVKRNELEKLQAEQSITSQQLMELKKQRLQTINALNIITGMELTDSNPLFVPDSMLVVQAVSRPEYKYYEAEAQRIDKLTRLKSTQNMPKIYAYAQTGYSYPGLNFFENQSDYFYIVGAKLSWTIFDWKQVNREMQVLQKQKEIVVSRKTDFERNIEIAIENEQIEQSSLSEILTLDAQIIDQRESISRGSAASLSDGVITAATYLEDLNNEIKARIDNELHKIQLLNSMVKLNLLNGVEIE